MQHYKDELFFVIKDHLGSVRMVVDSTHTVRSYYDYTAFGNVFRSGVNEQIRYQYTGQEYDHEIGLHNYRARFYDSDLGRFYGVDVAGQFWSPYLYVGNNPVLLVDPDGEFGFLAAILIGATIGGGFNLYQNWDNIDNFWEGVGYFGIGAASGAAGATGNPLGFFAGGAISGAGNTALSGGGFGLAFRNAFIGGVSGLAGGIGGRFTSNLGLGLTFNGFGINSPFLKGLVAGGLGGVGGGFAGGFASSIISGGDFGDALSAGLSGASSGLTIGAPIGALSASVQAHRMGRNPLTGRIYDRVTFRENSLTHGFRPDHYIEDTPENRELILRVGNKPQQFGPDKYGSYWKSETTGNGFQIWVRVKGHQITNFGINPPGQHYYFDPVLRLWRNYKM